MHTLIHHVLSFSHIGKRSGNEDCIITGAAGNKSFFVVCDGVGGQEKGEVASKLVCDSFQRFFNENAHKDICESFVHEALSFIQAAFDAHIRQHPETQQMATTFTLALLHPAGLTMAHLGDSRIYYFRNGNILYQTRDHNLVNELVDNDIISLEEAQYSAQKHIITRAISGVPSQSANPSYYLQNDVLPGDIFFLCSDGVTESFSSDSLAHLFQKHQNISDAINTLLDHCAQHSGDNYSGIAVQLYNAE